MQPGRTLRVTLERKDLGPIMFQHLGPAIEWLSRRSQQAPASNLSARFREVFDHPSVRVINPQLTFLVACDSTGCKPANQPARSEHVDQGQFGRKNHRSGVRAHSVN
jgi:hypothetical protein